MDNTIEIDLSQAARELGLPLESVQNTVALLDDGNTVPFITRFRKDQTGALDEQQIRQVQEKVGKLRALAERKLTILKSVQSQGVLTPELADQIRAAHSPKRLEDLYLPFKPKKQTLATVARQQGLEPLARKVLDAHPDAADLSACAESLVAPEHGLQHAADVLAGVRHIIAELFGERADARGKLRKVLQRTAKLVCNRIETPLRREVPPDTTPSPAVAAPIDQPAPDNSPTGDAAPPAQETGIAPAAREPSPSAVDAEAPGEPPVVPAERPALAEAPGEPPAIPTERPALAETPAQTPTSAAAEVPAAPPDPAGARPAPVPAAAAVGNAPGRPPGGLAKVMAKKKRGPLSDAMSKKEKKRQRLEAAFKDYFAFQEPIARIPPHRVLAINRGERARILRVKLEMDVEAMAAEAESLLIRPEHPHAEFLRSCIRDALNRLLIPSLERELRREMAEMAESHAVEVFARNLRRLLLQPPVHNRRVLAIDPGFRSGCKLIALDEFGNVLGHDVIHVIGREEWIQTGRRKIATLVHRHRLSVIAIGNGAGCRETEQLVVDVLGNELKDEEVAFVIVNEAGASVYSTSAVGREELPQYDAVLRSAISIGRRLLDPLSELVKINPANIGVGMYQHDVKAKHLRNSLDAVVESCVNYVGVDVNTASPALLRYVSGMNQLTARRLCEHRAKHGPFRNREELKQVSGLGEATFVQAAGFLKISHGDNPLDATWIHPESYALASQILAKMGCNAGDLAAAMTGARTGMPSTSSAAPAEDAVPPRDHAPTAPEESVAVETAPDVTESAPAVADSASGVVESAPDVVESAPDVVDSAPDVAESASGVVDSASDVVDRAPDAVASAPDVVASAPDVVERPPSLPDLVRRLDPQALAAELSVSELLLRDILNALARPGRDPREDLPAPVFRRGIVKLEDLEPGMKLAGTVLNVVDFGAFVDIGLPDSGLIHISRLADRFVRDPHEVVGVGDVLTVWVVEVDKPRRRVSLTAIEPGTERSAEARREASGARVHKPQAKQPTRRRAVATPSSTRPKSETATRRPKGGGRPRPPQKPKFIKPITKEMEEGKEPLRSFSDLMQFYQKKQSDGK